jgi:Family of unknown function (DUF6445)
MQTIVIDKFLPYPGVVREWALQQEFWNSEEYSKKFGKYSSWPGTRTDHVMTLDNDYANAVLSRFVDIVSKNFGIPSQATTIKSTFQLCSAADGDSWIHQDNNVLVAGILYLSPDAPIDSGTTIYRCKDQQKWLDLHIDDMKKINRLERKDLYDSLFEPVDVIGNVYNRLVVYSGDDFHKSNNYFGATKRDSRLTQVFFASVEK